jgi:hypothetical protein
MSLFLNFLIVLAASIVLICAVFFVVSFVVKYGLSALNIHLDDRSRAISCAIVSASVAFSSVYILKDIDAPSETSGDLSWVPAIPSEAVVVSHEASRLFAGPDQYPPENFAAYGILAFPSRATSNDRDRYTMLCEAYVAVLPHAFELALPDTQQMVTVWPVTTNSIASQLNRTPQGDVCPTAVDNYGLVVATRALKDAAPAKAELDGRGPFLLAWSPATQKGKLDALVLEANLSNVTTPDEAKLRLLRWKSDILENPDIWIHGWDLERVKTKTREWLDEYGPKVLMLFGTKQK